MLVTGVAHRTACCAICCLSSFSEVYLSRTQDLAVPGPDQRHIAGGGGNEFDALRCGVAYAASTRVSDTVYCTPSPQPWASGCYIAYAQREKKKMQETHVIQAPPHQTTDSGCEWRRGGNGNLDLFKAARRHPPKAGPNHGKYGQMYQFRF